MYKLQEQELVQIARGNKKLGKSVATISLRPQLDCKHNCKYCYALKAWRQYKETRDAWSRNSRLARYHRENYFRQIEKYIRLKQSKFFRWHSAGDILDQNYLEHMKRLARVFPEIRFLCFTKRHDLTFRSIPGNLSIVLSMDSTMKKPRKKLPLCWVDDGKDKRIPHNAIQCHGKCEDCGMCWSLKDLHVDVVIPLH